MHEQLIHRLETLKQEFELGQTKLQEVEMQKVSLRQTMLRISGAIQVLEELLGTLGPIEGTAAGQPNGASSPAASD